jgi:hypothetical protein
MWAELVDAFMSSDSLRAILALIIVDFALGVTAAIKMGTFAFSKVSGFLKDDVALKVFPYFILWTGAEVAGNADIVIPGLDLALLADGAFVVLAAAMVGSILSSVADLGLLSKAPEGGPKTAGAGGRSYQSFIFRGEHE